MPGIYGPPEFHPFTDENGKVHGMPTALIVVDVQRDFMPGGTLAVPSGDEIIEIINGMYDEYDFVAFTMDSHPEKHISFASRHGKDPFQSIVLPDGRNQMIWPDHCVQGSVGWSHPEGLKKPTKVTFADIWKGDNLEFDSYSGFKDDGGKETSLERQLKEHKIHQVDVVGVATDYCVLWTVEDATALNFNVRVLLKACRGVASETTQAAIARMRANERITVVE